MGAVGIASLCAAVVAVAVVLALMLVLRRDRRLRSAEAALVAELAAARAESADLHERLAELERTAGRAGLEVPSAEFVITDVGRQLDVPVQPHERGRVPDRLVLSATLGEPLVRTVALAHGVRRALSAESRNRIRFAMRQELRRTRRRRRREMKTAWRRMQAEERGAAPGQARDIA
jgi:hypothetical protein